MILLVQWNLDLRKPDLRKNLDLRKIVGTVKLGNKERYDKEQIGIKELFMDYQPFYTINLLLDKELLPI